MLSIVTGLVRRAGGSIIIDLLDFTRCLFCIYKNKKIDIVQKYK